MSHQNLIIQLQNHKTFNATETEMKTRFLAFVNENNDCFERSLLIGHITASAWILNPDKTKVLLLHHAKLSKWLQPGGHADGNTNLIEVALKETEEETGLIPIQIEEQIFDIDIHVIPARKDIPEHLHYDVRYLLTADETQNIIQNHESNCIKWIDLKAVEQYNNEKSILRMRDKTILIC